jgi:hypothetical protein
MNKMDLSQYYIGNEHAETAPAPAGLIATRRNRQTHSMVSLYSGSIAGMSVEAGEWQTVCEKHGTIISHYRQRVAYDQMAHVLEWCEECRAEMAAEFARLDEAITYDK